MGRARGKFLNYDTDTLVREFASIPTPDLGLLFDAMDRYASGDDAGFVLKSYGGGLLMLKKDRATDVASSPTTPRPDLAPWPSSSTRRRARRPRPN